MSLNASWLQQATRSDQAHLGNAIVIKSEDQSHISQAIVLKPEEQQHLYLQTTDASGQQRGLIKIESASAVLAAAAAAGKCSMFTQTEPTNRFTQTDSNVAGAITYRTEAGRQETATAIAMFEPAVQPQVYIATTLEKKDGEKTDFPFCYNVNMIQKVPLHTTAGTAVGTAVMDDKGCYRLDVGQSFSYNYVVNPVISTAAAYKCDICGLAFTHMSLLTQHKRVHSQSSAPQQQIQQNCETQTQTQPTQLQVHVQPQQQQQSQQMQEQQQQFQAQQQQPQENQQTQRRAFLCDICEMSFNLPGELKSHKNALHKDHQVTMNSVPEPKVTIVRLCESCGTEVTVTAAQGGKKKKFRCAHCGDTENTTTVYTGAPTNAAPPSQSPIKQGQHPVKRRGMPCVTKCHTCNGSGIIFVGGAKKLSGHVSNNDKTYHCNICDGTFSRYSSLWSHKRLHTGDKPFKCAHCGLCFAKAAYLKNHTRVHTGEKPFKCATCGMQFSQSPHLKNHERIHSGERPYQCEVCQKTFARHSTLWNHRRIHTGEKPYRCNVCDSKFNQATHLKNHSKVHTGEKPFKCEICEVSFADRFALKRHRLVHQKYTRTSTSQNPVQVEPEVELGDHLYGLQQTC